MIEPINFTAALRRSWRLLVALAVVFGLVAVLIPVSKPTPDKNDPIKYTAVALVGAPPGNGIIGTVVTSAQILFFGNSDAVKGAAYDAVKPPGSEVAIVTAMTATAGVTKVKGSSSTPAAATTGKGKKSNTGVIELQAAAATKELAVKLTNAYASALGDKLTAVATTQAANDTTKSTSANSANSSDSSDGTISTGYQVTFPALIQSAHRTVKPTTSVTSSRKVRLLAGVVLGLLVGLVIILLREFLNKRIRQASRAEAHFKFPVVAEIPNTVAGTKPQPTQLMVVVSDPSSPTAEAYRKLRMSVLFEELAPVGARANALGDPFADASMAMLPPADPYQAPDPDSRKVILVVSAAEETSRSEVVANLGATYAEAGERVIVTSTGDLDSGAPGRHQINLTGDIVPQDIVSNLQPSSIENVSTLSLRPFVRNSGQLVNRAQVVLDAARQVADVVIVEAPPLLEFHHGEALVHAVDVVLVVSETNVTTFDDADQVGELLRRLGAPVLGLVFTRVPISKKEERVPALAAPTAPPSPAVAGPSPDPTPPATPAGGVPDLVPTESQLPAETQA